MSGAMEESNSHDTCLTVTPDQKITVCVIGSFLALVSAVGNAVVIWTVYRTTTLHSVAYYFLAFLAMADFFVGIIDLPLWTAQIAFVCDVFDNTNRLNIAVNFFYIHALACATFSLSAVSVDRYIAVKHALRYNALVTSRRCFHVLGIIWASSLLLASLQFIPIAQHVAEYYWLVSLLIVFALPFLLIIFCYLHIFTESRRQIRLIATERSVHRRASQIQHKRAAVTFAVIIGVLFLCVLPILLFSVTYALLESQDDEHLEDKFEKWFKWALLLTHINSVVNPWIYCVRKKEFRDSFRKTLVCWRGWTLT